MIDQLNRAHGIAGQLVFEAGQGGLAKAVFSNPHATAEVYLQGATVTAFQPRGTAPALWLSSQAQFKPGKAIRGGIPVCWPWFGPHPTDKAKPQHGFARNAEWAVTASALLPDGRTQLRLRLADTAATRAIWPHPFELEMSVTAGAQLEVSLTTRNTGPDPVEIGGALHTYFNVGDISRVGIVGLDGRTYLDQLDGNAAKRQHGPVTVDEEVDRVYLDTTDDCLIWDAALNRHIRVAKRGSRTTVIWNPWIAKAARMADFPDDGYLTMVCVETANAATDVRTLAPGGEHTLTQVVSVKRV